MGVYIKGMEMPKYCDECRCICSRWNGNEMLWRCGLSVDPDYTFVDHRDLYEHCPLTEVPEPHGRLIDADACIDYIRSNNQHAWEVLAYAPTVIERSNNE